MRKPTRTRNCRRAQAGVSLIEALMTTFIGTLILSGVVACVVGAAGSADRARTNGGIQVKGQKATDELFYQVRGASQVLASQTLGGTAYTTGAATVVISAPGMTLDTSTTPATPDILTSITDYFAFSYSPDTKILYETIVPGTGSARPTRTRMALAKNVSAVAFTYKVRDQYTASASGTYSKVISYAATSTPSAYVNGASSTCTYNSGTQTATVSSVPLGADVEFVYPVSPTNTSALAKVTQVDATVTLQDISGKNVTRTVTLTGTARLRNMRN